MLSFKRIIFAAQRGKLRLPQSILQISELLRQGSVSPVELTTACLARVEKLNPRLNAFITVTAESALAQARQAEAEIRRGDWRGPLHGIPLALKDLIDTAGVRTTAASFVFKDRIPSEDAEVVRRLKAAGAVLAGKAESARIRLWRQFHGQRFRRGAKRMESGAHHRRFLGRLGHCSRRRAGLRRDRHRHCRLGPGARARCAAWSA